MTKVFWSWQSDIPGNISRHLVRDALDEAIRQLKSDAEVSESERPDVAELHLDHDRKGVPGSPDLAKVILEKIDQSAAFIADVTTVGLTLDGKKKLMNANVAIELGYALKSVGDHRILMVLNESYGTRADLPFDLRHKAGPICYVLGAEATKLEIRAATSKLAGELKLALRDILSAAQPAASQVSEPFPELPGAKRISSFIGDGERLVRIPIRFRQDEYIDVIWRDGPQQFLRVIPTRKNGEWNAAELVANMESPISGLRPFGADGATYCSGNKLGAVSLRSAEINQAHIALCVTQVTKRGEIWGVDCVSLRADRRIIYYNEPRFAAALNLYLQFATTALKLSPPFKVVVGMTGVADFKMAMPMPPPGKMWLDQIQGLCVDDVIVHEMVLQDLTVSPFRALLPFFNKVWGACQIPRPDHLPKE